MIYIQDSGPGLPISIAEWLMDPFATAVNTMKSKAFESTPVVPEAISEPITDESSAQAVMELFEGEGIGLRIVKQFSKLLGTKLEIKTIQGQGTIFRLWLPAHY